MEKQTEPDPKLLDRVIRRILLTLLSSDEFSIIVDEACKKEAGVSTPYLRTIIKEAFRVKVGI